MSSQKPPTFEQFFQNGRTNKEKIFLANLYCEVKTGVGSIGPGQIHYKGKMICESCWIFNREKTRATEQLDIQYKEGYKGRVFLCEYHSEVLQEDEGEEITITDCHIGEVIGFDSRDVEVMEKVC